MLSKIIVLALAVATVVADLSCPGLVSVVEINSMTPEIRQGICDMQNDFRRLFANGTRQPKASNMKKLVYSEALEAVAQQIINTCSTSPISGLKDADGHPVGQLTYSSWSSKNNPPQVAKDALNKWTEEKDVYKYPASNSITGKAISTKLLQLISANTANVGCNRMIYTTLSPTNTVRYNQIIACVYSPSAAPSSIPPYEEGDGCEELC